MKSKVKSLSFSKGKNKRVISGVVCIGIVVGIMLITNPLSFLSPSPVYPQAKVMTSKKSYKVTESVVLTLKLNSSLGLRGLSIPTVHAADKVVSEPVIIAPDGKEVRDFQTGVKHIGSDEYEIRVNPPSSIQPGKYTTKIVLHDNGESRSIEQDFTWGVLAINTDKSIYLPNENASVAMAVLDENGMMVCDAKVKLSIKNDELGIEETLTTEGGLITINPECKEKAFTLRPDYESSYQVSGVGKYEMTLTAQTGNGSYTITDSFEVREHVPFDVKREGPTRIYPPQPYPVKLTVTAEQDFAGTVTEIVPKEFVISPADSAQSYTRVEVNGSEKVLVWDMNLKKGQTKTIGYTFKAPDISPQFYLTGPLTFYNPEGQEVFAEIRQWQIAGDEVTIDATANTSFATHNHAGSKTVFINDTDGYVFYTDDDGSCVYNKTTDSGANWGGAVTVDSQTDCVKVVVWYDRWTPGDTTGNLIHIITADTSVDDLFYRNLDTGNSDTLSTGPTAISSSPGPAKTNSFDGAVTMPTITKATDGEIYVGVHDNTAGDNSFIISCSATCTTASNWADVGTLPIDTAATSANDMLLLMPLAAGDILAIRHDDSADDVQSKVWNESAWDGAWTDIDTTVGNHNTYDSTIRATVDRSTNDIYLAYLHDFNDLSVDDHDIQTAIYSGGTWTAKTDAITDGDDGTDTTMLTTGLAISMDDSTGDVYVVWSGGPVDSDDIYYRVSTDGMQTWGARGTVSPNAPSADANHGLNVNLVSDERIYGSWYFPSTDDLYGATIADLTPPASGPTQIVFTNSERTLEYGVCNGSAQVFTIQLQDGDNVATNPTASTVVRMSSDSTGETIYTDDTCSTTATNGDFTFSTSEHTKSVYVIDTALSSPTWTLSATRQSGDTLTTGTQTYTVKDVPAVDVRGGVEFRGGVEID